MIAGILLLVPAAVLGFLLFAAHAGVNRRSHLCELNPQQPFIVNNPDSLLDEDARSVKSRPAMTDEEFQIVLTEFAAAENSSQPTEGIGWLGKYTTEQRQAILDECLAHMHGDEGDVTHRARRLAGVLLRDGISPTERAVIDVVEAQLAWPHPVICLPMPEFVEWVERTAAQDALSVRLLTCLRKLRPALMGRGADKAGRDLIRRLSLALKLTDDAVIPEVVDAWTSVALAEREKLPPASREQWDSLLELASKQQSAKPGKTYLKEAQAIAAGLAEFPRIMRNILESIGRDGPVGVRFRGFPSGNKYLLDDDFTSLLRALIWLCGAYPELCDNLREAAERCVTKIRGFGPLSPKIAVACTFALSQQDNASATRAIFELQTEVKHKSTKRGLQKAITEVEARSGTPRDVLEETIVPDLGFSTGEMSRRMVGDQSVMLCVSNSGLPVLVLDDAANGCAPATSGRAEQRRAAKSAEVKSLLRDVRKVWRKEVLRLERMMRVGRAVSCEAWLEHYVAHPIVGQICRRLLWMAGDTLVAFRSPSDAGQLDAMERIDGSPFTLSGGEMMKVWHPCELREPDRQAWERWVLNRRLIQPFQQAVRAVYRPEARADGRTEDFRFVGEMLHQGTLAALSSERGWCYSFHDGQLRYEAPTPLNGSPLSALVNMLEVVHAPGKGGRLQPWHQIRNVTFHVQTRPEAIALDTVPPVVFSEVMRDIDLFIAASRSATSGVRNFIPRKEQE